MAETKSGWAIKAIDIPVADAAQYANGIEDLYNGTLDVIVLRGALPAAVLGPAGRRLDTDTGELSWARPNQKNPADDIRMLGVPATPTYATPTGPSADAYFDQAEWTRRNTAKIFGADWDAVGAIEGMLARFAGGRPVVLPSGKDGKGFQPFTVRRLPDGTGISLHHDYHFPLALYDELRAASDTSTLLSFFVTVQPPDAGGELTAYPITPDEPNPPKLPNGWAWDVPAVEARYPGQAFTTGTGDLFLFASGRCLHRVNPVVGPHARITMGGFLSLSANRDRVLYWS
ncbi:MAG: 2OG-Fe(II) oxygenase [Vicinamibacterales bacterium]